MPRIQFTKAKLDALRAGAKRIRYTDERTPHLALYVTANGQKAFYYYRKLRGTPLEIRLGAFAEMNIAMARERVEEITGRIVMGLPPIEIEEVKAKPLTFGALFEHYMVHHAKANTRSWRETEGQYRRYLEDWREVLALDVDPAMVAAKLLEVRSRAPVAANRLLTLIRAVYNYAIGELDMDIRNPARRAKATREEPRRRYLNEQEVGRLVETLDRLAAETAGRTEPIRQNELHRDWVYWRAFFMLLLYTGARRSMVQRMEWSELNLDTQTWIVPGAKMKAKRDAVVVLPAPACAILKDRPRTGSYVFPGRSGDAPVTEVKGAWSALCAAANLDGVWPHDLRRTFGTWQLQGGAALATVRDSLAQSDIRVTQASYAHVAADAVRESVEATAARIITAASPTRQSGAR